MSEEAKQAILDFMKKKKGKTKYYSQELCKAVPNLKMRQCKKTINELVNEGKLNYQFSGDSTLYLLIHTAEADPG
jgi:predicted HTH transcriptional regulator